MQIWTINNQTLKRKNNYVRAFLLKSLKRTRQNERDYDRFLKVLFLSRSVTRIKSQKVFFEVTGFLTPRIKKRIK